MIKINLGDEAKDSVSGFKGIVTSVHVYLHGCERLTLTSRGKDTKDKTFDLPQLILIKKEKVKQGETKTGGPSKYIDEGR